MSLYVVSDLHIRASSDPIYRALLKLIEERLHEGDTLVLAGDIFDLFVGNKRLFRERYAEFLSALREAGRRGARIDYIEGNHDFLIRGVFRDMRGVTVHSDTVSLKIGGKRFFVAHGDLVDAKDYPYRILRAVFRSPLFRAFVKALPGQWVDSIGRGSSRYSRGMKPLLPQQLPTDRIERLRNVYRSFAADKLAQGNDFVVLGHCHDLDEMSFSIGGREGQYINVGFPPLHGSFLSWSPGEAKIGRERL